MGMKVLVIDSGGRGHAWGCKLAQSARIGKLFFAPGNGGTAQIGENVPIKVTEIDKLVQFAEKEKIDFTAAIQDDSLAAGIVDAFTARGLKIFGSTRQATEIEASKAFAKRIMSRTNTPTAPFRIFTNYYEALEYLYSCVVPIVVKASGLALGKGAYVCQTVDEAQSVLHDLMIKNVHGDAGKIVVIEDYLAGPEVSIHAFCDAKGNFSLWPSAQDHKPAFDLDRGPNTGGMGTIAPVPWFTESMMQEVGERIVGPVLRELRRIGSPFVGCLYPGLKSTPSGLKVLEFNARPGDPETQSYMRLLKTDLLSIMEDCTDGTLGKCNIEWYPGYAVCIILASGGYPGEYKKGLPITGIEEAERIPGVVVFHAGTKLLEDGTLVTSGGRVLGVTAIGDALQNALETAYEAVRLIKFEGMHYRADIGAKSLAMAEQQEKDKWLVGPA